MFHLLDELTTRGPWRDLDRIQRGLNELFSRSASWTDIETTPINVYANDDAIRVIARIPGWHADWFDLSVEGNRLFLKGETQAVKEKERTKKISRAVSLPYRVQSDQVRASYKNGLLAVDLAKHEQDRPRKIQIQTA